MNKEQMETDFHRNQLFIDITTINICAAPRRMRLKAFDITTINICAAPRRMRLEVHKAKKDNMK